MEIVEPRSATPYMGVLQSWATVDMAYMHGEGISVLFPSLVFSKRIVVNPAWMKMDGTLPPPLVPSERTRHAYVRLTRQSRRHNEIRAERGLPTSGRC